MTHRARLFDIQAIVWNWHGRQCWLHHDPTCFGKVDLGWGGLLLIMAWGDDGHDDTVWFEAAA